VLVKVRGEADESRRINSQRPTPNSQGDRPSGTRGPSHCRPCNGALSSQRPAWSCAEQNPFSECRRRSSWEPPWVLRSRMAMPAAHPKSNSQLPTPKAIGRRAPCHGRALSRRRGRHGHARSKTRSANAGGEAAGSLHGFCGAAWPCRPRILVSRPSDSSHNSRAGHPGWLRCSSFKYAEYSQSSRLAIRAPRSATYATTH
jgi:hypothetical protein